MEIEYGRIMIVGGVVWTLLVLGAAWLNWQCNRKRPIGLPKIPVDVPMPAVKPPKEAPESPESPDTLETTVNQD